MSLFTDFFSYLFWLTMLALLFPETFSPLRLSVGKPGKNSHSWGQKISSPVKTLVVPQRTRI